MSFKPAHAYYPKIKFTKEEDEQLTRIIQEHGTQDWELISSEMKNRTARQCRERWINYISPGLSNAPWTMEEDKKLDELYAEFGSRWHKIAEYFPNRSGNCVRNRYKLRERRALKKSKKEQKIKPVESKPVPQTVPKLSNEIYQKIITPDTDAFLELFQFDNTFLNELFETNF